MTASAKSAPCTTVLAHGTGVRLDWMRGNQRRGFAETLQEWQDHPSSALPFAAAVAAVPYASMYWECPPFAPTTAERAFECVLLPAPSLHCAPPDPSAFADRFAAAAAGAAVVAFHSLSGSSVLVAPLPHAAPSAYGHLAAFVRVAPLEQVAAFFACVAGATLRADSPAWLSTAGDGVAWVHGRIDPTAKYYRHAPYRTAFVRSPPFA